MAVSNSVPVGAVTEETIRRLIFKTFGHQRFTQDSPILPDVWLAYARDANVGTPHDLLLTPKSGTSAGAVAGELRRRLTMYNEVNVRAPNKAQQQRTRVAYTRSAVAANLRFDEIMCVVVPMTNWWRNLPPNYTDVSKVRQQIRQLKSQEIELRELISSTSKWEYFRFAVLAGFISTFRSLDDAKDAKEIAKDLLTDKVSLKNVKPVALSFVDLVAHFKQIPKKPDDPVVWNVSINRSTDIALFESRSAIKADAAQNVFRIRTDGLAWAVIDCGIDARHPAFLDRAKHKRVPKTDISPTQSRILATYDFTYLRDLLALQEAKYVTAGGRTIKLDKKQLSELADLERRVGLGREIDWGIVLPLMTVPHNGHYEKPSHEHGTHVAGIIAGNWPANEHDEEQDLIGVCPDLQLFDMRVFDSYGRSDEFTIMASLQVIAHLNRNRDNPVVHGVNLSLSLKHEVISYACGRTPICDECHRLIGDGTVVVAAAGNQGFDDSVEGGGPFGIYRDISITDPGNAEDVITVGSTHRSHPHSYGVSYFSSRGPTGDGRRKPDLVAPGEKITAPIPNRGSKRMDGTSMAAPHVSGAAALLMARHRELVGRPDLIKQILCKSATDLGREPSFQGAGMLDVLRALQSV